MFPGDSVAKPLVEGGVRAREDEPWWLPQGALLSTPQGDSVLSAFSLDMDMLSEI